MPYDDAALERFGAIGEPEPDESDKRSSFARDRDRILYCSAFLRLAGKSQVAAAGEFGLYHNRLTHTLKVAQLGRRLAERLRDAYIVRNGSPAAGTIAPPDPDLVEAACLAHDLGHPPFGHVGEETLGIAVDALTEEYHPKKTTKERGELGGFEGNAQTFRVAVYLSARLPVKPRCGLDLTRATLDAATKYPWLRSHGDPEKLDKWGAYQLDAKMLEWVRTEHPPKLNAPKCFESELMDWCDDVTYAVHDVLDFYRGGHIPLHELLAVQGSVKETPSLSLQALDFIENDVPRLDPKIDLDAAKYAWTTLAKLSDLAEPWEPRLEVKAATQAVSSRLITYFTEHVTWSGDAPCRYDGQFVIDPDQELARVKRLAVDLLKLLLWCRVIERPALTSQQRGQKAIVSGLLEAYASDQKLLPADRREEIEVHNDPLRAAADHVASLTERDAHALYQRMTGVQLGALTDPL